MHFVVSVSTARKIFFTSTKVVLAPRDPRMVPYHKNTDKTCLTGKIMRNLPELSVSAQLLKHQQKMKPISGIVRR